MKKLKQTKKLGVLTLALAMVLALLPFLNPPAQAAESYYQPPAPELTASVIPSNSGGDDTIRTILILDVSGSIKFRTCMLNAAQKFLDALGEEDIDGQKHELAIVAFSKGAKRGKFTSLDAAGKGILKGELESLKAKKTGLGCSTNLGLGLQTASDLIEESGITERCNIILFSDFKLNHGEKSATWLDFSKYSQDALDNMPPSKIPLLTDIYSKPSNRFRSLPAYRYANKVFEKVKKLTDSHNLYSIGGFYGMPARRRAIYGGIYMEQWQNAGRKDLVMSKGRLSDPAFASGVTSTIYGGFTAARNALKLPTQ